MHIFLSRHNSTHIPYYQVLWGQSLEEGYCVHDVLKKHSQEQPVKVGGGEAEQRQVQRSAPSLSLTQEGALEHEWHLREALPEERGWDFVRCYWLRSLLPTPEQGEGYHLKDISD